MSAEFGKEASLPQDYLFWERVCSKSLNVTVTEDLVIECIREFIHSVMSVELFNVISFFLCKMQSACTVEAQRLSLDSVVSVACLSEKVAVIKT